MHTQTIDITDSLKQLNYRLSTLKPSLKNSIAVVVQRLRIRGFGQHMLIDAMLDSKIWEDAFYKAPPVLGETLERLNWIATDNGCLIGHDLTINQIHYNFLNQGIVV